MAAGISVVIEITVRPSPWDPDGHPGDGRRYVATVTPFGIVEYGTSFGDAVQKALLRVAGEVQ